MPRIPTFPTIPVPVPKPPKLPEMPRMPHHSNPIPKPLPQPNPSPAPQPLPKPDIPKPPATPRRKTKRSSCPKPGSSKCKKVGFPKDGKKKKPKQQRPCGGQKPDVSHTLRRRKIGEFWCQENDVVNRALGGSNSHLLKMKSFKKWMKKKGYEVDTGNVNFTAVHTKGGNKGTLWRVASILSGVPDYCYYDVYVFEKRRKCTCPDGSPCKR